MCFDFFPDLSNESVNFAFVRLVCGVIPEFPESIFCSDKLWYVFRKAEFVDLRVLRIGGKMLSLLQQLDVPLFKFPASEKELDKILLRLKNKPVDPPQRRTKRKARSPRSSPPPSPTPPSPTSVEDARLEGEEEEMELSQQNEL
ncbi:hypothetical protein TNCV_2277491 [Trichonephila clavipes]|nr:hypothetical protein TNCV_2277491 [Trichonephila clavipes]